MSEQRATHLFHQIDEKLDQLSPIPSERCIFRVHDRLRNVNAAAYEPKTIAIGPYHHRKYNPNAELQAMEEHKLLYLRQLLKRRNETSVKRYVMAMQELEERARNCYSKPISLDTNEFVEMMLLDSCFIIELLRKNAMPNLIDANDPIFQLVHVLYGLAFDLMLFENQLPFFVLLRLFNMTKISDTLENMIHMSLVFFVILPPLGQILDAPHTILMDEIDHLLGLVHYCCCFGFDEMLSRRSGGVSISVNSRVIKSATELQEAGIKFEKVEGRILFDIRFLNGRIEIPILAVEDGTESVIRNLIVYEQYLPDSQPKYFVDYTIFMDYLVNTSKDVEILRQEGIIIHSLGDDEVISEMLNKLGREVGAGEDFSYSNVFSHVNEHCGRQCNTWMASLRRNYFNSPWALISFLAAVVLLLLTVAQTIFSAFSVTGSPK